MLVKLTNYWRACRFGGVEATTFCCLSALYEQMQIDKQVDVFLHASLCQQARPNVWRKQDDFLFLYKTLTGLELDVGTWSKKRYSYSINKVQQTRPVLTEVGYQAAMDMSYSGMSISSTLGPGFRSHQQYQMASIGLVPVWIFKGPWNSLQTWIYVVKFDKTLSLSSVWNQLRCYRSLVMT